jgi:uncharacterized DUF497 family protein
MKLVFEWDDIKAEANLKKHKVSFEEAKTVFNDPRLLTFPDERHSGTEDRLINIGMSARARVLTVVNVERVASVIRIISCRRATRLERETYEENLR